MDIFIGLTLFAEWFEATILDGLFPFLFNNLFDGLFYFMNGIMNWF